MTDFDVVLNYLPPEGHPQDVEEDGCPYCALRRIEAELAALKARRCATCDEWDGPMGNGMGKCCYWTINSSPADPGCGETHFRDTHADGFCHRWQARL